MIRGIRRKDFHRRTGQIRRAWPPKLNKEIVAELCQSQRCEGRAETRRNIVSAAVGRIGVAVFIQSDDLQTTARAYDDPVAEYAGLKLMRLLGEEDAGQTRQEN